MNVLFNIIKRLVSIPRSHRYRNAGIALVVLISFGTLGIFYFEHQINDQFSSLSDGLWWSFVTISTVGYGDKYPITMGGRFVGLVMMFGGIGTFGYVAGTVIEDIVERRRGISPVTLFDHYVICNYNRKAKNIIEEIHWEEPKAQVVLTGCLEENPLPDSNIHFIKGDSADEEVLIKASIKNAKAAIVLASDTYEEHISDSHSVLTTLAIRHLNPFIKITAEALDIHNETHLLRAGASEVIISERIVSRLIARSNFYDKSFIFLRNLVSASEGMKIYDAIATHELVGLKYGDLCDKLKGENGVALGLYRENQMMPIPDEDTEILHGDHVIYIALRKLL